MKNRANRENLAQGVLAYVVFIAVVTGALVAMKFYLLRTVQEKYRQSSDVWGEGEQYEPNRTAAGAMASYWQNKKELCPEVLAKFDGLTASLRNCFLRIDKLQQEIADLEGRAVALESRKADAEAQAQRLDEELLPGLAAEVRKIKEPLQKEADKLREEAKKRKVKIKKINE
ncbi:MAG: hypothetical protein PHN59_04440 [Candidatus Omnitrophica bacterium]|nr:hypothetical protein [Candidatus Omnitrophota bacterium]